LRIDSTTLLDFAEKKMNQGTVRFFSQFAQNEFFVQPNFFCVDFNSIFLILGGDNSFNLLHFFKGAPQKKFVFCGFNLKHLI